MNTLKAIFEFSVKYVCELVLLICLVITFYQQINNDKWKQIIRSDGLGYYAYLPAVFIYHDCKFEFLKEIDKNYNMNQYSGGMIKSTPLGKVNKFYVGLSIFWLPFFWLAHLFTLFSGGVTDGYTYYYQIFIAIAANFYLWLGCKFTRRLIIKYAVSEKISAFIILLIVFGTNLSHYATYDSNGTHVYSFAAIAAFLLSSHSFFEHQKSKYLYWCAFLIGIIFLLRPSNILVIILFPFFTTSLYTFITCIKSLKKEIAICFLIFLITIVLQFIFYFLQTGHFIVWSYDDETFNFSKPEFLNVLFSYRKGLFIYAPLILVSLSGLYFLFKKNKFQFSVLLFFLLISCYIISSWWCWSYGCCLGQRSFVDYSAIFALLFSFLFLGISKSNYLKALLLGSAPLFIFYSMMLSFQFEHNIISWDEMNKEKFWAVFMKTGAEYEGLTSSKGLFSGNDEYHPVSIKAANNLFLCADEFVSDQFIMVNRNASQAWETFNLINAGDNKVAFKTYRGNYISARLDSGSVIKYSVNKLNNWETFEMIPFGDKIALKACNGKYVSLNGDRLFANSDCLSGSNCFFTLGVK